MIKLTQAYRLLNHGPTILVSSSFNGKQNIMAAAWNMPLDFDPPKICVVIDKKTYTRELIEASGSFAINVPCVAQVDLVTKLGSYSGRELQGTDKFAENQLQTFAAKHIAAPLLTGCVAWLECKIIPEPHNQNTYDLFIAEVVAAYADERVFSNKGNGQYHWHFEGHDALRTIHHVAGGAFFAAGKSIQAQNT
ncbi:MAG TPA: flavin reductase family protein [Methylotenera sp.]|nr:flavin reductase family protein [Methylotenera sp.]HPH06478.1 flavin reductase family protein [Methylotenera sp.]HPN01239.1 flavin reductase family protein [Methylotenera sp.]